MANLCSNIAPLRASASSAAAAVMIEEDDILHDQAAEDVANAEPSVPDSPPQPQPDPLDAERVRLLHLLQTNRGFGLVWIVVFV